MNKFLLRIVMFVASFGGVPCSMSAAAELRILENSLYQMSRQAVGHVKKLGGQPAKAQLDIETKKMCADFTKSAAVQELLNNSYITNVFFRFRAGRFAEIYRLKNDMPKYEMSKGDFFYQDMGHGDQLEVFGPNFKPRTVLRLKDGSVDITAYEKAKKRERTLFTTPWSPNSPTYVDTSFNALTFGDKLRAKSRKTNLLYKVDGIQKPLELYIVEDKEAKKPGAKEQDVVIGKTKLQPGNLFFFIDKNRIEVFDHQGALLFDLNAQGKKVNPTRKQYTSLFVDHKSTKIPPIQKPQGAQQPQPSGFVAWLRSWWPHDKQTADIATA